MAIIFFTFIGLKINCPMKYCVSRLFGYAFKLKSSLGNTQFDISVLIRR